MAVRLFYKILAEDGTFISLEDATGYILQEQTAVGPDPPVEPLFFGIMQGPVAQDDIYERLYDDEDLLILLGG